VTGASSRERVNHGHSVRGKDEADNSEKQGTVGMETDQSTKRSKLLTLGNGPARH